MKYLQLLAGSLALTLLVPIGTLADTAATHATIAQKPSKHWSSSSSSAAKSSKPAKSSKSSKPAKSSKSSKSSKHSKHSNSTASSSSSISSAPSSVSSASSAVACSTLAGTDNTPAELGISLSAGTHVYLSLQLHNAAFGAQAPEVSLNNAFVTLISVNGSTFLYEVLATDNLPSTSQLLVNLSYQQLDAEQNVTRELGIYETLSHAVNGGNRLVSINTILVDASACGGSSSSADSSSSATSSSTSSSSSSTISCSVQAGADTGTANLGFGIMAGQNYFLSLQLRNADYLSPIQVSLENADVMEIFASGTKRLFQVSALQNIPSSSNLQFNYSYQQLEANQSVWRDVAIYDTVTTAVNDFSPLVRTNTLLVDATNCD